MEVINEKTTWSPESSIYNQISKILYWNWTSALEAYRFHLEQLLEEYYLAKKQLERVEQQVKDVFNQISFAKKLLMMKGISEISLVGILDEASDLSGFSHGNSLLRYAGLHLAEASSGKWKGQIVLSKRGRS